MDRVLQQRSSRGEVYNYAGALNDFTSAIKLNPISRMLFILSFAKYNLQKYQMPV